MRIADDVKAIKAALDKLNGVTPSGREFSAIKSPILVKACVRFQSASLQERFIVGPLIVSELY